MVDNGFIVDVQIEIIRYATINQMFCPNCMKSLDWTTTVFVEFARQPGVFLTGDHSVTACGPCYDQMDLSVPKGTVVNIYDGRVISHPQLPLWGELSIH